MIVKPALVALLATGLIVPEQPRIIFPKPAIVRSKSIEVSKHMLLGMPVTMGMLRPNIPTLPVATYQGFTRVLSSLTTYNFTSVAIGTASPGRLVVCFAAGYTATSGNVVSATIGGVTATVHTARNSGYFPAIISAVVPTGTTATVSVTLTGAAASCWIGTYTITGLNSTTPLSANNAGQASSGTSSVSLTTAVNGVVIAGGNINVSSPSSSYWSAGGIVNDYIANADGGGVSTQVGKSSSTGSSLTVSQTASVANAMATAAWR